MKSEIKDLFSTDIEQTLEFYIPDKPDNFGLLLDLEIGLVGQIGADIFQVMLCTPNWLIENTKQEEFVLGLHYLIVFEYNYEKLNKKLIELFCIEGKDWDEIANKLSYIGLWEYQNYKGRP
ncbi:MAG TPA: Imm8 family immunity protein [Bacteroidales bacterium]|mgnify:CR=1 FL=1|nr:Imm8 family immunity protein [Bacteroidales bacterium]